jgi:copper(I)-binding protein
MLQKSKMRPALMLFLGCLGVWHAALAQDAIRISNAWINEAPPGMKMMGGYLSISNNTLHDIVLTGATSPCFKKIEFHVTEIKNGISSMHKQETITIPSGSEFSFSPGHYHLMLINQTRKLAADDTVPLTLHFAGGNPLQVMAEVRRGDTPDHQHH